MNWSTCKLTVIFLFASAALAQQDVKGSADPALFPHRMPGFFIYAYEQVEFASHSFATRPPQAVEGKYTKLDYIAKAGTPNPGDLAVRRNYENAVKAAGGEILYSDAYHTVFKAMRGDSEVWTQIDTSPGDGRHLLHIIEKQPMRQVITADTMAASMDKTGFVALDIHFSTGKAEILPESQPTVKEIAAMLKTRPTLRVGIEGHTDNSGSPATNKALSASRAQSVSHALCAAGIDSHRLRSAGFGQERPIADNRLEEGRAKNRRVEIVKD